MKQLTPLKGKQESVANQYGRLGENPNLQGRLGSRKETTVERGYLYV